MTLQQKQKVIALLGRALELEGEARIVFINENCEGDEEIRAKVMSLLELEPNIGDFIETPVFRIRADDLEPLTEGQRLGAYRILSRIGRGGMGSVFLAESADNEFPGYVAIKVIRTGLDTEALVRRFRAERQILSMLDHENIAKLFDGGTTEDGRPYFVMEYVEGQPIDEYCNACRLSVRQRLELAQKIFSAVHFAHQNLVVHSDLKPANIIVTAAGIPKLLDFGTAKLLDRDQLPTLTRVGLQPLTPAYASPEQVQGESITTASDIYSLGVLLYVLLTGHHPYQEDLKDPHWVAKAICEKLPPRPSSVIGRVGESRYIDHLEQRRTPESVSEARNSDVRTLRRQLSGDLESILEKAMNKKPHLRYSSVAHFSDDISCYLKNLPVSASRNTLRYRIRKFIARHLGSAMSRRS